MLRNAGFLCNTNGTGRSSHFGSQLDRYVITRKNNIPELIFNQNSYQDYNVKKRYYDVDHDQRWTLNDNTCQNKDVSRLGEEERTRVCADIPT